METREHFADLLAALLRGGDDDIARDNPADGLRHRGGVRAVRQKNLHRIESARGAEQFLRPADVHRRGADVGQRGGVIRFEDEPRFQFGATAADGNAQGIAGLQP